MVVLREKYVKPVYLVALILIQLIGFNTVHGLSCVQCGGNSTKCSENLSETPTSCPANETFNKCYTEIDVSGSIKRGCRKQSEEETCKENCSLTEDGKNNQLVCKTCEGTDEDCSQSDVGSIKYNKICDAGITKCIKKVDNKLVVRGCASQLDVSQCTDKNICETCDSVNCNAGIFPADRLKCYHCSDDKCNDVAANNKISTACLNFVDKDECYTKGESEATMLRGCKSDTKENKCSSNAAGCTFCNASGCNNLKYKRPPAAKCYQCTGDSKNADCFKNQADTTLKSCEKELLYSDIEYCYTQYEDGKINRGCLHDSTALTADKCNDKEGGVCNKCIGNGCNGKLDEFTCIVCRSDEDPKCYNNATELSGKRCRTGDSSPVDGCFQGIWRDVTIRGCTIDASEQNQAVCKKTNNLNNCKICHSKDCNTKKSSAAKKTFSFVLMSMVLITLWNFK